MKLLMLFLSETEMFDEIPLYEAVVRKLNSSGVAGATVMRGIMGFGEGHHVHRGRLFGVSDDRPVVVLTVDEEAALRSVLPELRKIAPDKPMLLLDAEWLG